MSAAATRRSWISHAGWLAFASLSLLAGCDAPRRAYDAVDAASASVGIAEVRTWADRPSDVFGRRAIAATRSALAGGHAPAYLAISGGAGDGAYGAGLLNGWTRSGRRPAFAVVTGVSTGALIAPFAFLGPRYDATLTELYTSGIAETLIESPDLVGAVFGSSLFPNERLKGLVARYVTPELVAEIGRETAGGRLLLVLTTNLDSQRPVLWDMGRIARENTPAAIDLFRNVLVASASVPAIFPPILIDAEANGRRFDEMHVDGSISADVFTLPRNFLLGEGGRNAVRGGRMFILLNTDPRPAFAVTENRTTAIVGRTTATGFKEQVVTDLALTYTASKRYGFDFNLTYNDTSNASGPFGFETAYMRRIYQRGEARGATGTFWQKSPPDRPNMDQLALR